MDGLPTDVLHATKVPERADGGAMQTAGAARKVGHLHNLRAGSEGSETHGGDGGAKDRDGGDLEGRGIVARG